MTTELGHIDAKDICLENYRGFVGLKLKSGGAILTDLDVHKAHMLHMAVGIVGEVIELVNSKTFKNTFEELGDIEFFLEGLCYGTQNVGVLCYQRPPKTWILKRNRRDMESELLFAAGEILDIVKKYAIYNKPLNTDTLNLNWHVLHVNLEYFYAELNTTRLAILQKNAEKLNKRYVKAFSNEEAQARNDKQGNEE